MEITMQNKRVLITAGAAGICRAVAEMFITNGASVHICDINRNAMDEFKALYPEAGTTLCDVSNPAQVSTLFEDADKHLGGLDILINGAGTGGGIGPVEQIDIPDWEQTIAVNLSGSFYCARLAVPRIKRSGTGSIINFSSTAGFLAYEYRSPYAAAKWGIIGFSKTLALELGRYGIRVNAICPGAMKGERMDGIIAEEAKAKGLSEQEVRDNYVRCNALKTFIDPREIASTILFLCSEYGSTITGQAIAVDGFVESHK